MQTLTCTGKTVDFLVFAPLLSVIGDGREDIARDGRESNRAELASQAMAAWLYGILQMVTLFALSERRR